MKYISFIFVFYGLSLLAASPDKGLKSFDGLFISGQYQLRLYVAGKEIRGEMLDHKKAMYSISGEFIDDKLRGTFTENSNQQSLIKKIPSEQAFILQTRGEGAYKFSARNTTHQMKRVLRSDFDGVWESEGIMLRLDSRGKSFATYKGVQHRVSMSLGFDGLSGWLGKASSFTIATPTVSGELSFTLGAVTHKLKRSFSTDHSIPELGMILKPVLPGTFIMGSPASENDRSADEAQHKVTISHGLWMAQYEVTQRQYKRVMKSVHGKFKGDNLPVERVSWNEAISFCKKLTEQARKQGSLPKGYVYRLPTEAEWEYACRAGTNTSYFFGKKLSSQQANYDGNYPDRGEKRGLSRSRTTAVGSFPANAWGLHDMHGNVMEWCLDSATLKDDLVTTEFYRGQVSDPLSLKGDQKIVRGGDWYYFAFTCRSANRRCRAPEYQRSGIGFRIVLGYDLDK